jgi:hypothetical protein
MFDKEDCILLEEISVCAEKSQMNLGNGLQAGFLQSNFYC